MSNAQITGAKIVSYNCSSFTSYGKEDGENAPVSEKAAHEYACALNYLLSQDLQRTHIGDATVVFWTDAPKEKAEKYNYFAAAGMDPSRFANRAQDSALVQSVREWLKQVAKHAFFHPWTVTKFIPSLHPVFLRIHVGRVDGTSDFPFCRLATRETPEIQ